jgi:hypothetical protein
MSNHIVFVGIHGSEYLWKVQNIGHMLDLL